MAGCRDGVIDVLALVAYMDRSAFMAGVHAWTVEAGCQADHEMVNALAADRQLPRMTVEGAHAACTVKVIQTNPAASNIEPHRSSERISIRWIDRLLRLHDLASDNGLRSRDT